MTNVKTANLTGDGWITFEEIDEETYAFELKNLLSRLSLYKVEETDFKNDTPSKTRTFDFKISGSASELKIDFIGKPSYPEITTVLKPENSVQNFDQRKCIVQVGSTSHVEAMAEEKIRDQGRNILNIENTVTEQYHYLDLATFMKLVQEFIISPVSIFRIVAAEMQLMTGLVEILLTNWPLDLEYVML
uniref:Uncharacterized protein n=1 Tax=Romanomermis culicivorax TaxID=13658 RepID=A0A915IZ10_ROMCU